MRTATAASAGAATIVDADLAFCVEAPGARPVAGRLTGSGSRLELQVDAPFVFAGRRDARAIRGLARALAAQGLSITVVAPSGPLVTLGVARAGWWQRRLTRSRHIRVEGGAGLTSLVRGRVQAGDVAALPAAELAPPATVWPPAPTLLRRPRRVTTTHDPERGGDPRLVLAAPPHPGPDWRQPVFRLRSTVVTIGSAADCDVRLAGLEPWHAEVVHDEADEFHVVRTAARGALRVNGAPVERALLRTGVRVDVGGWTMGFLREEHADHGRPYGGRIGGELGYQRRQPPRSVLQPPG